MPCLEFRRVLFRSEEHTSELQSHSISYAVFCLKKKNLTTTTHRQSHGTPADVCRDKPITASALLAVVPMFVSRSSASTGSSFRPVFFFLMNGAPPKSPPFPPPPPFPS